ncbi:carotenoid oxygenase family protein [Rhodococcus sp. (in: high G+C Gram-positive bacteria)]|uniref:carotenoid oxygenase family protein n=1 Tax=unclassified Rhodococcus (in: high G+C Gram-positive bacteria) TaxID=192944 RepID=UPI0019E37449|nr:carotenoid oxygenase family protein [Rhodococcus sp. (in: high G+C Gram-positive bacteria)]MBF0662316.1 carotenoid oxygenase family protein [Rhodococcus sp. (in: high G+C Gram-positive bacteria)]
MDLEILGRALSTLPTDDDHPYRTGPWRPQVTEHRADDLEVVGELPADLDGVYIRNTENPVHPAQQGRYHPFDGDGMVHVVGFRDGKAFYRNRFVQTDGFVAEQEAGRALWAGIAENPAKSERTDGWGARTRMKDGSSTDVTVHNGVALTSFWQCGDLYRVDPMSLETVGKAEWGGDFPSNLGVSAHPKVDHRTGEMLFFNYGTDAPYMHYGVVDSSDKLVHYTDIELPGPRLPHDMAFTENYAILNDCPLFWIPEALAAGKYVSRFHPDIPMRLGVLPRRGGGSEIRWFDAAPTYVLHWTNAYEDGDEIVLEGFHQETPEPEDTGNGSIYQRMFRFLALDRMGTHLHRWRLNLRTGGVTEERLSERVTEFGMISPVHTGVPHRYTYAATGLPGWFLFDGLVKHDSLTGAEEHYALGEGVFGSETVMAPRIGSSGEDDGYLVTMTVDMNRDLSECLVFDAQRLADGPVARIRLPERVSSGTHSTWASGAEIPGWRTAERPEDAVGL